MTFTILGLGKAVHLPLSAPVSQLEERSCNGIACNYVTACLGNFTNLPTY